MEQRKDHRDPENYASHEAVQFSTQKFPELWYCHVYTLHNEHVGVPGGGMWFTELYIVLKSITIITQVAAV